MPKILTPDASIEFFVRGDSDQDCDYLVVKEAFVENVYQIEPGDFHATGIFLDVGANIGAQSIYIANMQKKITKGPKIRVIAVEPEPANLEMLKQNIEANGFKDTIEIHEVAIMEKPGSFYISSRQGNSTVYSEKDSTRTKIRGIDLNSFLEELEIEEVDVMKVDIEGAELDLFRGATDETLRKIRYITVEFGEFDKEQFGELIWKISKSFNTHIIGSPERGGYIYGRRY